MLYLCCFGARQSTKKRFPRMRCFVVGHLLCVKRKVRRAEDTSHFRASCNGTVLWYGYDMLVAYLRFYIAINH